MRCDPPGSQHRYPARTVDSIFSNPYLIRWLAMGGLVLLVAFFAMSETSLFSLSPLDRLRLKEKQPARGGVVEASCPGPGACW